MNELLLKKLADRTGVVPSPGDSTFLMSPTEKGVIEAAVLHHHRFAFYYWIKWATEGWTCSLSSHSTPSDLVTVDYHDDVGGRCDCVFEELSLLLSKLEVGDVSDEHELLEAGNRRKDSERNVATYSILGLRALNDGHIFPAQYLNAIGDVFILYKQRGPKRNTCIDQYGNKHHIRYFNSPQKLAKALAKDPHRTTFFDLDIDYFFEDKQDIRGNEEMVPEDQIRRFVEPQSELMSTILHRNLRGITFALEPTYCGGLPGCFRATSIVMESLFSGALLGGSEVSWR